MYEERVYRKNFQGDNLVFYNVIVDETDLYIGANKNLYELTYKFVLDKRKILIEYIEENNDFLNSFKPIDCKKNADILIQKMCIASRKANVGPMATVAGAISEEVGKMLLEYSDEIIVENGGDIFIKTKQDRKIGIFAGNSPLSNKIGIIIKANESLGICTSAGTIGHSFSYGKADAAVIVSKDTYLADALATYTGNLVKSEEDIENTINIVSKISGIVGIIIIKNDKLGVWGNVQLTRL